MRAFLQVSVLVMAFAIVGPAPWEPKTTRQKRLRL